ncbi:hypothetical protein SDC9_44339 [bioreactor metagenome]|uniref:Uncharacterized protein n=1 Tax=bioreactor metagenome TaxID=1076179 RepID=A0A644W332_9ZZZZ
MPEASASPLQIQYAREIYNLIMSDIDTSVVTVSTGRCGIGKSKIVRSLISYFTQDDYYQFRGASNCIPMIIVTDMLERLYDYQKDLESIPEDKVLYYESHKKHCTYISSNNSMPLAQQLAESVYKPVVLLTTQRYFEMPDEQREILFTYRAGKPPDQKAYKREIVIMDERPYFYNRVDIKVNNLNDCDTALHRGILRDDKEKDWLISEYAQWRDKMTSILRNQERNIRNVNTDIFYWRESNTTDITSDDEKLFKLLEKHKTQLIAKYPYVLSDFRHFKQLMTNGAFFISTKRRSDQEYNTQFLLIEDNRDKFFLEQDKAKFFVLDGTADIDPVYKLDYINLIDSPTSRVPLNLTIEHRDVGTSQTNLKYYSAGNKLIDAILTDVLDTIFTKEETLLVTYKKIEKQFAKDDICIGHFGGLKGLNDYINIKEMIYIGFNRAPDLIYLIIYLVQHTEAYQQLQQMSEDDSRKHIKSLLIMKKGCFINPDINQIMFNSLLADFEQNIFRTAIRRYDNEKHVTIFTYWNCKIYIALNKLISERYLPFGVEIINIGIPKSVQKMKTITTKPRIGDKTNPQKLCEWIEGKSPDTVFKISEARRELQMSSEDIKNAKKNKTIKSLLNKYKTNVPGVYLVS